MLKIPHDKNPLEVLGPWMCSSFRLWDECLVYSDEREQNTTCMYTYISLKCRLQGAACSPLFLVDTIIYHKSLPFLHSKRRDESIFRDRHFMLSYCFFFFVVFFFLTLIFIFNIKLILSTSEIFAQSTFFSLSPLLFSLISSHTGATVDYSKTSCFSQFLE